VFVWHRIYLRADSVCVNYVGYNLTDLQGRHFINVDYEQRSMCVGTVMICLHTKLHYCSFVIDINRNKYPKGRRVVILNSTKLFLEPKFQTFFALPDIVSGQEVGCGAVNLFELA
jgi:hypothetical protein